MAGYQPDIYASISVTLTVAAVALACRLTARRTTKQRYWYDDYFAVIAFIAAVVYCSVILNSTINYGLGTHIDAAADPVNGEHNLKMARLNMWIGSLSYASSIAASKASFLTFYWRIFQFTMIRIPIQFLLVVTTLWIIIRTCLTILQCLPVNYIWDKNIAGGSCAINQSMFFFSSVLVHCIMDMIILILPVFPIFKMHLTRSKKLGIVALFSSGIVVCVASVFVLIQSITVSETAPDEIPANAARNWYWAAVEVNMAIFSGSLPMLRPIVLKFFPSCMSGSDHYHSYNIREYDNVSAIELARTQRARKKSGTLPSNLRKSSRGLAHNTFDNLWRSPGNNDAATAQQQHPGPPGSDVSIKSSVKSHDSLTRAGV